MSDPSNVNWKHYSLFGALVAATVILLGFIAEAIGIIEFRFPGAGGDTPIGGASPSDIVTTGEPVEPALSPEETGVATGTWESVYEEQILSLDSFLVGTDSCDAIGFDLDTPAADGTFAAESAAIGESPAHIDIIWDPCSGYDDHVVYLTSGPFSLGSLWAEGTVLDAAECLEDNETYEMNLYKMIDPESPSESWFSVGQVLCMLTSEDQVVIADLTSVEPASDEYPGLQATFEVTLWARA